jgi:hypothetical protein
MRVVNPLPRIEVGRMYFFVTSYNLAHWLTKQKRAKENLQQTEDTLKHLLSQFGIACLQECGPTSYQRMLLKMRGEGYGLYWGPNDGKDFGARSTPIVWDKEFKHEVIDRDSKKLTRGVRIAIGAGPTLISPKYAHCVTFDVDGRRTNVIGIHGYASLWAKARWPWANRYFRRLAEYADSLDGLVVITGDFNTTWDKRFVQPLKDVGFRSLQEDVGPVITHPPKGRIDDVIYRYAPFRLRPMFIKTRNTNSDHHALIGGFFHRPKGMKFKDWQRNTGIPDDQK